MNSRTMWAFTALLMMIFLVILRPTNSALFVALTVWLVGGVVIQVLRETRR
jgi:hypothetical protein